MIKRKLLVLVMALAAILLLASTAVAEADPIVTSIEVSPSKLTGPGPISVTITVANSGDTDLQDPVVLYDPAAKIVSDFGENGAALLKAGETKTWTGTYDVNQRTLDNGSVVYFLKYTLYTDSGEAVEQSAQIRAAIGLQTAETAIEVRRTITPSVAKEGQSVVVRYDIINTGTVNLYNITLEENKDIYSKKKLEIVKGDQALAPGKVAEIKLPVTMGKKDLTSSGKITYTSETQKKKQTYTVEKQVIKYGEASLEAKLASSAKGVTQNGTVTLTLTLKNTGTVDYSDIRVTDASLGDVFTNQAVKAGQTLTLEKEVAIPETMDFQFTVAATDATGTEMTVTSDTVSVTAVDPSQVLHLTVNATADRTEVFEQPGRVRFTIEVTNDSTVDAKAVSVRYGDVTLYTYDTLPAGESRSLSRDTAVSMAGKYRFTVTAKDSVDVESSFDSNDIQIAFSVPTPAPATPTPPPVPTAEPTFAAATIPPLSDPSIAPAAKAIHSILMPIAIVAGVLLIACGVLLLVASKRRADQRKASESAIDQLERAKRRDYAVPAEEQEPEVEEQPETVTMPEEEAEDFELPHLKYARKASKNSAQDSQYSAMNGSFYDDLGDEPEEADGYQDDTADLPENDLTDDSYDASYDGAYDDSYDDSYDEAYDNASYDDGDVYDDLPEQTADAPQETPVDPDAAFRRPEGRSRRSRR